MSAEQVIRRVDASLFRAHLWFGIEEEGQTLCGMMTDRGRARDGKEVRHIAPREEVCPACWARLPKSARAVSRDR